MDIKTTSDLNEHVRQRGLAEVDSRQWGEEWGQRWVVFVDLIAFAARSSRSRDVVLNNILRFDRASALAHEAVPDVQLFRFSDSTFAVADIFDRAVAFAISIQHSCLAINVECLKRASKKFFIHTIVPKVTIAYGSVLRLPESAQSDRRFDGIDPRAVIAGDGIVKAYGLERRSSGGLITVVQDAATGLQSTKLRGSNSTTRSFLESWTARLPQRTDGLLFVRDELLDLPWLLFRPIQADPSGLWCAEWKDVQEAVARYFDIWDLSLREFYSPQGAGDPLDTSKHAAAGIRHGVHCAQAHAGQYVCRYYSLDDAREMLATGKAAPRNMGPHGTK